MNVPFASLDLLASVVASRPPGLGGLDGLTVDHSRSWAGLSSCLLPSVHDKRMVDPIQSPLIAPSVEVALNRCEGREVLWQQSPLAAGRGHIQQGVDHLAQISFPRTPALVGWWHERLDQRPLIIGQIACIAQSVPLILRTSDFSPGHRESRACCKLTESYRLESLNLRFFGQPLKFSIFLRAFRSNYFNMEEVRSKVPRRGGHMIPFSLHRRIPLIRRPFWQRDEARAEAITLRNERDILAAELKEARTRPWQGTVPDYAEDCLIVWNKSVDFLTDARMAGAYKAGMDSGHQIGRPPGSRDDIGIRWRVAIACWCAHHAAKLPGDFVECGVNTGIMSLAICHYLDFGRMSRNFWLFDTFEGIPRSQMSDAEIAIRRDEESDRNYPPCFEQARQNFAPFPNVKLVKGTVPDTLSSASIESISYLSIDMNIAYPERAAIEHFWPRVTPGGVVLLDDYGWSSYDAQKRTMDEFAVLNGIQIMALPTGQGLLIRP